MKTIGIIGGLGPHSTLKYYAGLTQGVQNRLGGANSAKIILSSVNGEEIKNFRFAKDKNAEGNFFAKEAQKLQQAGADFISIASNTSHKNAPFIEAAVSIPLIHLADTTADAIVDQKISTVALVGTILTMEQDFYKNRLIKKGLKVIVPKTDTRHKISNEIYQHLVRGSVRPNAPDYFLDVITDLKNQGAEAVILGCTELTLLNIQDKADLPLFDTTQIHVNAALDLALA